jgi:cell division protein FtsW
VTVSDSDLAEDGAEIAAGPLAAGLPLDMNARLLGVGNRARRLKALLDRPLASYYLVLGSALLLLAVGLMMVLSTSTAYDLDQGQPPYSMFQKQLLGAAAGLVLLWLASRAPARVLRACAYPLMLVSLIGLVLVLMAPAQDGVHRWLTVAGLQVQPSEFAKLALVLWGADLLARKERLGQLTQTRHLLLPLLPGAALMCMLVMLGKDLGTTFLLLVIFMALLVVIGTPGRVLFGMIGLMAFALLMVIVAEPYELQRLSGFLSPHAAGCSSLACYQLIQGKDALGSGGLFGVGLGASTMKWGLVPNSPTDFIFAILGQELGLIGTVCVVALYGGLAFAGLRIARRVPDTFARLAAAAITVGLVVQAMVNMGAVLGLLPITGVPLPLISAGVSSLIATLAAVGMLMSFARSEPGAAQALAAGGAGAQSRLARWLGLGRRPL